jgi:hypothetical protein
LRSALPPQRPQAQGVNDPLARQSFRQRPASRLAPRPRPGWRRQLFRRFLLRPVFLQVLQLQFELPDQPPGPLGGWPVNLIACLGQQQPQTLDLERLGLRLLSGVRSRRLGLLHPVRGLGQGGALRQDQRMGGGEIGRQVGGRHAGRESQAAMGFTHKDPASRLAALSRPPEAASPTSAIRCRF